MIKKEIFLDNLPRWKEGRYKGKINWKESIGYKVKFIYDDIEGYVEIIDYIKESHPKLKIKYNDNFDIINTSNFMNCKISKILNKRNSEFKIEIGTRIKDDKRDITIIDRKIIPRYNKDGSLKCNDKYYKYKCNKCGFDGGKHYSLKDKQYKDDLWILESSLLNLKQGCSCCASSPQIVVEGVNDIVTTDPWMIPIINDIEFCKTHTHSSNVKIYPTCPECKQIKYKLTQINTIYEYNGISCVCNDNMSKPNKILYYLLQQLKETKQISSYSTEKTFNWSKRKIYDGYIEDKKYIIEMHGQQHYRYTGFKRSLEEEQENDEIKKELAIHNGIKEENYIIIDCKESEFEYIKNNILHSRLNEIFDLSNIDWNYILNKISNNLLKEICIFKNNNPNIKLKDICDKFGFCRTTIDKYLKIGNMLGWCEY